MPAGELQEAKLTTAPAFDVLIVIPTLGKSDVLLPSFERLLDHLDGLAVHIVVSLNPKDQAQAQASLAGIQYLWKQRPALREERGCALSVYMHPEPCGFGGAINRGLMVHRLDWYGTNRNVLAGEIVERSATELMGAMPYPDMTVIWNDDLHVTDGWLVDMLDAMNPKTVQLPSEVPNEEGDRPDRSAADYGRIGLVGPVSNVASGIQTIGPDSTKPMDSGALDLDEFAAYWRGRQEHPNGEPLVYTATFLSGFCMGLHPELIEELDLAQDHGDTIELFDERYKIAGYEDNDLCARADMAGWRAAVSYSTFIRHLGHQTFDSEFADMQRGMRNRLTYYDVWRERRGGDDKKIVAAFRILLATPNDVNLLRMALARAGQLVDGIAILLTGPLSLMTESADWREMNAANQLPADARSLAALSPDAQPRGLKQWAKQISRAMKDSRRPEIRVEVWGGEFNERDERNHVLRMAESMGADWVLSIDHDEAIEPRVTRAHLDRLMRHPDPLVQQWDMSWINHWANNRWQNVTPPWGDGGTYLGGMHGFRLYRVNPSGPRAIQAGGENGLHCGNVPMTGPTTVRVSGIRFRHFGYMRAQDRFRKLDRYNEQDPTPNPVLVGGTSYAHITHEENQLMSAFVPVNGIGVHALLYEGEDADDLGRWLDKVYGLADRIVLVWTGEWADHDRRRIYGDPALRHEGNWRGTLRPTVNPWDVEEWPETGPGREVALMAEHFGVEWVHQPLNDDIAAARNAGIDALHGTPGLGWGFFFDPDEHLPQNGEVGLRRMAEVTDAWGWLFRFENRYSDGRGNQSEAVRMHRLDDRGVMRMNGRVHESFSKATRFLVDEGFGTVIRVSPDQMTMLNTGLALDPDALQAKLNRYRRLTELELKDDPHNPGAWTTLGLYWANEGYSMVALECFSRGMTVATGEYLPFQEAGNEYLRLAAACFVEAGDRMGQHKGRRVADAIVDFIAKASPPLPVMGRPGNTGLTEAEAFAALPAMSSPE